MVLASGGGGGILLIVAYIAFFVLIVRFPYFYIDFYMLSVL